MRKTPILMNKAVYLSLLILESNKILMCEFWHDYVKLKNNLTLQIMNWKDH